MFVPPPPPLLSPPLAVSLAITMEPPLPILPDDIIEDIFKLLPASSALRCRGLSRAWAATLSSAAFVDRHRHRHRGLRFFLFQSSWTTNTDRPKSMAHAYAWSPARPDDGVVPLPPITPQLRWCPQIITLPCRGLVLLDEQDSDGSRCVYNPSTGQIALLPPCHWWAGRKRPEQRRYESFGLGYDARSGKHKVVRIHYRGDKHPVVVQVYVLDDEGFWRAPAAIGRPEATKPPGWVCDYEPSVFAQGHLHWMAQKEKPKRHSYWRVTRRGIIVSFSVADEAFGVVPLPPRVDYLGEYRLTELEGRLCIFSPIVDSFQRGRRPYDVWSLRDHKAGTWELRCRIDPELAPPEFARLRPGTSPVAAMDDGRRILFMKNYNNKGSVSAACPLAYTPATGNMERMSSIKGLIVSCYEDETDIIRRQEVTLYEESVVSPGRPHEKILFSQATTRALCVALAFCSPPARDLMHLKLVCRSWRAMIESKRFLKLLKSRAAPEADQVLSMLLNPPRSYPWGKIW